MESTPTSAPGGGRYRGFILQARSQPNLTKDAIEESEHEPDKTHSYDDGNRRNYEVKQRRKQEDYAIEYRSNACIKVSRLIHPLLQSCN